MYLFEFLLELFQDLIRKFPHEYFPGIYARVPLSLEFFRGIFTDVYLFVFPEKASEIA